jgi:hypothetical protein
MGDVSKADLQKAYNNLGTFVPLSNVSSLTKKITFFNGGGNIYTGNYDAFKAAIRKINLTK